MSRLAPPERVVVAVVSSELPEAGSHHVPVYVVRCSTCGAVAVPSKTTHPEIVVRRARSSTKAGRTSTSDKRWANLIAVEHAASHGGCEIESFVTWTQWEAIVEACSNTRPPSKAQVAFRNARGEYDD